MVLSPSYFPSSFQTDKKEACIVCIQLSGINCVQLVGSMSIGARDAAVNRFNEDPDCTILLMSLKAGGIAC